MRLTQIKLAGFKSFVDPTSIPVPGQLVAVCGPNGCGKSNVIDAVRWVLGESSAKQLRGESMQDVIFNGSDQRKPAARASVELVFDNGAGRASGPWSQYAEIAIRRVLTKAGDSSYYINSQAVRRRDITDLFLGTGVGARGYAVIEQGMISRIIEARPEELRLFLEEAAGVSKYKERRRETESRLGDARDNLLRLDDIRLELAQQLEKLSAQAEVAQQWLALTAQKQRTEQHLAVVRLLDAEREQARWLQEGQQSAIAFEAAIAGLREVEACLETLRESHFQASDRLHVEQGRLYEANARLARLEQQLTHVRESRERLTRQISQDKREQAATQEQLQQAQVEQGALSADSLRIAGQHDDTLSAVLSLQQSLPELEAAFRSVQQTRHTLQQKVHEAQRQIERVKAAVSHQASQLQALQLRESRLREELRQASSPSGGDPARLKQEFEQAESALLQQRQHLEQATERLKQTRALKEAQDRECLEAREQHAALRARRDAIQAVLQAEDSSERVAAWLAEQGWQDAPRLLESLRIEDGWEAALEAVLGQTLSARVLPAAPAAADTLQAPARAELIWPAPAPPTVNLPAGLMPLVSRLQCDVPLLPTLQGLLQLHCCPAVDQDLENLPAVPPGYVLVLADGRQLEAGRLRLPGQGDDGLLLRKAELSRLEREMQGAVTRRDALLQRQQQLEQQLQDDSARRTLHERELKYCEHAWQEARLLHARQEEQQRVLSARCQQVGDELDELELERETLALSREDGEQQLQELGEAIAAQQLALDDGRHQEIEAEVALDQQRSALRHAEREQQEALFQQRLLQQKQGDLQRRFLQLGEQAALLQERLEATQLELEMQDPMQFDAEIQLAIDARSEQERVLADARDRLASIANQLRQAEEERHRVEEGLEPLRQRVQALQLKEQEARLHAERQRELLADADRAALEAEVAPDLKPATLAAAITRLQTAIDALGAVNLAAVEELAVASERRNWLDAQAEDLNAAITTLSEAIARIDAETRERLQATYLQVNHNLGELFPLLFGGGRAELVLTGEEILDAGLQIIAQPPGKKNSSITLLSGGEKALTALSLVFALFRLNPAPFCLLDEVDAPLDDANTTRFCELVKTMAEHTQFLYISHNRLTMEMAEQLIGITMQEKGVSRMVAVDIQQALSLADA